MTMEITLQILQTIGICVGAIALAVIAFTVFMLWSSFIPTLDLEDEDSDLFAEEEQGVRGSSGKRRRGRPKR